MSMGFVERIGYTRGGDGPIPFFSSDAKPFLTAALENDTQNLSRYLSLATHIAGTGRYQDANEILRKGLLVYPHSTLLRELRQSFSLLAGAAR